MRNKVKKTTKYALTALLLLALLIAPTAAIIGSAADDGTPRVELEWQIDSGVYVEDGVIRTEDGGSEAYRLAVRLTGSLPDGESVTVSLEKYGISAPSSSVTLSSGSVTLSNGNSVAYANVIATTDASVGNGRLDVKYGSRYYTPLCGVRISKVTGPAEINAAKRDLVCALPYSTAYNATVSDNRSFGYYATGEQYTDYNTGAWVFSDFPAERSGKFNDMPDRVKEKKYDWSDAKSITATVSPLTGFERGEMLLLKEVLSDEIKYYYRVYGKVTDEKAAAAADVWWQLYHGDTTVSEDNMGDPGGKGTYLDAPHGDGYSYDSRYLSDGSYPGEHKYLELSPGVDVSLTIWNNSDVYDRLLSDFNYRAIALDATAPTVEGYGIPSLGYTQGDSVYLTVYFSENVQALDKNMRVKTLTGNGTDGALWFDYFSGSGTNALVFKATLDSDVEFNCSSVKVVAFQDASVADLMWNGSNRNNFWEVPKDRFFDDPIASVGCNIDTRVPVVTVGSQTEGVKKAHSVTLGLGSIGNGSTLRYTWSQNAVPSEGDSWSEIAVGGKTSQTLTREDGTGLYYLHVELIGVSRRSASRTVGPFKLDNSPPNLHTPTVELPSSYLGERDVSFSVSTADYEAGAVKYFLYYKSVDGGSLTKVDITDICSNPSDDGKAFELTVTNRKNSDGEAVGGGNGLIELSAESFGGFRIGFGAEDSLGNAHKESEIVWFGDVVMFDNRAKFDIEISTSADVTFADRTVYYNTTDTGSGASVRIDVAEGAVNVGEAISLSRVYKDSVLIYNSGSWLDSSHGGIDFQTYTDGSGMPYATVSADSSAVGYYELVFKQNSGGRESEVVPIFFSGRDEVSLPENYEALFKPGRLLNNRVWQISTKYYYALDNSMRKTYAAEKAPIFSSPKKALEYVRYMEYRDISVLYIGDPEDPEMQAIISALNRDGLSVVYNKAPGQEDISAGGFQLWLRYKSPAWEPSGDLDSGDWVYYYYGAAASSGERVSVTDGTAPDFPDLLREAIDANVKKIVGENGWINLTANTPGGTDSLGQPYYDPTAIFLEPESFLKESVYSAEISYSGDPEIYGECVRAQVNGEDTAVALAKHYTAAFSGPYGRIYYRLAASDGEYGIITKGDSLASVITSTGLYEFVEFGEGYKKYYVYVDNSSPVVEYEYERAADAGTAYIDPLLAGSSVRASSVTLKRILSMANYDGTLRAELDPQAYLYITNAKGIVTFFSTLSELDELAGAGGFSLDAGVHNVHIYDRLGNGYTVTLKVNSEEAKVDFDTSSLTQIRIRINRTSSEIEPGSFAVYLNDELLTDTVSQELTYDRSGVYRVVFKDIYGADVDRHAVFQRAAPELKLSYYDSERSRYVDLIPSAELPTELGTAYLQMLGDTSYYLVANMTVRVAWSTAYDISVVSGEPKYTLPEYGEGYMFIDATEPGWVIKIAHKKDPDSFILLSCIPDTAPPEVTLTAKVPEYRFSAREGEQSVLVELLGVTELMFSDGAVRPASSLTFAWSDVNPIYRVTLSHDGGEPVEIDLSQSEYTVTQKGHYLLTVTDIIGNTATRSITVADDFALDYYIDGEAAEYRDNPFDYIKDGEYLDTQYTGAEVRFELREAFSFAILYKNGSTSAIRGLQFDGESVALYTLDTGAYTDDNIGTTDGVTLLEKIELDGTDSSGTLFDDPFVLRYELRDGVFSVIIPECRTESESWQIRVSDISDVKQRIIQISRSNLSPTLRLLRRTGGVIEADSVGFIGVNTEVYVDRDSMPDDLVSVLAYYSPEFTSDFAGVTPKEIFLDGAVAPISEEGYYRIVAVNRYGNTQILQFKISLGLNVSVDASYYSGITRRFEARSPGSYAYKTNGAFTLRLWSLACDVTAHKDGEPITLSFEGTGDYWSFTLGEIGEYEIYIVDDCSNEYSISLSVTAPVDIDFNEAYLSGFNEKALRRDEHYTNSPVSVVYDAIVAGGIRTVWVQTGQSVEDVSVIYDTVSDVRTEYTEARFKDAVGRQGDGEYTVVFADEYGNQTSVTVKISTAELLSLSRLIQSGTHATAVSLTDAISRGLWTNRRAILSNVSSEYLLMIDGVGASFTDGLLTLDFPLNMSEGDITHRVEYTDEYGNSYSFDVHLYRKVPKVTLTEGVTLIDLYGSMYSRGGFGYTWDGALICATYSKDDGDNKPYERGEQLLADGTYVITFTDLAGNQTTRTVTVDTEVDFRLQTGEFDRVYDGVSFDGNVSVKSESEEITVVKVVKDGVEESRVQSVFSEHGSYEVTLMDRIGNTETVRFTVYKHAVKSFTFVTGEGYAINQLWLYTDGFKVSYAGEVGTDGDGNQQFTFYTDGRYELTLLHVESGSYTTFDIYIDNAPPASELVGVESGGSTRGEVTVTGLTEGDTVQIYKDGELKTSYTVHSSSHTTSAISEPGKYRVVISDAAGNTVEYSFTREFTTNRASNIVIILLLVMISLGGLVYLGIKGKKKIK